MKKVVLVLGTAREGNFSQRVAKIALDHLESKGFDTEFVDVGNFAFGRTIAFDSTKEPVRPWADIVAESDAFVFICPEYNHSYPGELKILIDSLSEEYKGKIAGIVSVSMGQYAGVRAAEALRILLHTVNFAVAHSGVAVANVQTEIQEERIQKHLDTVLEEMATHLSRKDA